MGGTSKVSLQYGKLIETLSGVFILGKKEHFQSVSIEDSNKSIIDKILCLDIVKLVVVDDMGELKAGTDRVLGFDEPMLHAEQKLGLVSFRCQIGEFGEFVTDEVVVKFLH